MNLNHIMYCASNESPLKLPQLFHVKQYEKQSVSDD